MKNTKKPVTLLHIKEQYESINPQKMYRPVDLFEMGVIVNRSMKPSLLHVYRTIRNGKIKTINVGAGDLPQYFITGKNLKLFLRERYDFSQIIS